MQKGAKEGHYGAKEGHYGSKECPSFAP